MRILVAGATGVLGRPLVRQLVAAGHQVVGTSTSVAGEELLARLGAEPVRLDLLDQAAVASVVAQASADAVVHQATAIPRNLDLRHFAEQMSNNDRLRAEGTRHLVEAAAEAGVGHIVAQSIAFAYAPGGPGPAREEDPLWLDAREPFRRTVSAIATLERLVTETAGLNGTVLRYGTLYGPGTVYAPDGSMTGLVRKGRLPIVGHGQGITSFVHTEDAAAATVRALEEGAGGIFNVVDDEPAPMRAWVPVLAAALGAPRPRRVPALVARLAAGRLAVELATSGRGAVNARARSELGWQLRYPSWREGLPASVAQDAAAA
jgi:2-alkyl-3-oxoalkanoate reductase